MAKKTVKTGLLPTMTEEERNLFLEIIQEESDSPRKMAVLDGFEDCLLYYAEDEDGAPVAVYCYEDLVEPFARKNKTTYLEAVEFVDYNTMRTIPYMTHVGKVETTKPIMGNEQGNPMPLGLGGIARHAVAVPNFCNDYTCAHITDLVYCSRRPRQERVRHCNQRTIGC